MLCQGGFWCAGCGWVPVLGGSDLALAGMCAFAFGRVGLGRVCVRRTARCTHRGVLTACLLPWRAASI